MADSDARERLQFDQQQCAMSLSACIDRRFEPEAIAGCDLRNPCRCNEKKAGASINTPGIAGSISGNQYQAVPLQYAA
jgi:hypothetical protein